MQFVDNHSQSAVQHMVQLPGGGLVSSYEYVVAAYGMRYEQRWHDVGCLFAFAVGACVLRIFTPACGMRSHSLPIRSVVQASRCCTCWRCATRSSSTVEL